MQVMTPALKARRLEKVNSSMTLPQIQQRQFNASSTTKSQDKTLLSRQAYS
jgi:hypothetical protein